MFLVGGEGGIRSGRRRDHQRFRPECNRQKLQKRSNPGGQVQNRYSESWVGNPPTCRQNRRLNLAILTAVASSRASPLPSSATTLLQAYGVLLPCPAAVLMQERQPPLTRPWRAQVDRDRFALGPRSQPRRCASPRGGSPS